MKHYDWMLQVMRQVLTNGIVLFQSRVVSLLVNFNMRLAPAIFMLCSLEVKPNLDFFYLDASIKNYATPARTSSVWHNEYLQMIFFLSTFQFPGKGMAPSFCFNGQSASGWTLSKSQPCTVVSKFAAETSVFQFESRRQPFAN